VTKCVLQFPCVANVRTSDNLSSSQTARKSSTSTWWTAKLNKLSYTLAIFMFALKTT